MKGGVHARYGVAAMLLAGLILAEGNALFAADLYKPNSWSNLAVDRVARNVGDSITVLIYENSVATNSARNGAKRRSRYGGRVGFGSSFDKSARLELDNGFDGDSETGRAGRMVAQMSAVVESVLPNGDLRVSGAQVLRINNERTNIAVRGRVRREDISPDNTVLSSRLADAEINYDGRGFVSRGARPGIISRLFAWLGLS